MPHLNQNPSSSIQSTNAHDTKTLFSFKEVLNNNSSQPAVYRSAAPKFIPASTIKINQAKNSYGAKVGSKSSQAHSASIKNLHETRRQINNYSSNTTAGQLPHSQ